MLTVVHGLLSDESGVSAIEYAFLASLIAVAIAAVVGTVGTSLSTTFATIASSF
jgi:pilus assembly protein Flp/PilA